MVKLSAVRVAALAQDQRNRDGTHLPTPRALSVGTDGLLTMRFMKRADMDVWLARLDEDDRLRMYGWPPITDVWQGTLTVGETHIETRLVLLP